MDTEDFLEDIKSWMDIYRDMRIPELEYPPATKESDIKWETGMLRVAASFKICDSLKETPAESKVRQAVKMAGSGDHAVLKDIYDLLSAVEKYLGEI